jgi:hypothetical protein
MKKNLSQNEKATDRSHSAGHFMKNLLNAGSKSVSGIGLEHGVGAILARNAIRRLPPPFNLVPPALAEKLIMKYGVAGGRSALLTGLRWVKKITDEKTSGEESSDRKSSGI